MEMVYWMGGIISVILFFYLLTALLKPELF